MNDLQQTARANRALHLFLACSQLATEQLHAGALDEIDPCLNLDADLGRDAIMLELSLSFFAELLDPLADADDVAGLVEALRPLAPPRPPFDSTRYSSPVLADRASRRQTLCWPARLAVAWIELGVECLATFNEETGDGLLSALVALESLAALNCLFEGQLPNIPLRLDDAILAAIRMLDGDGGSPVVTATG